MSIFVLNLATLLGLGLGVDYSLLMTSRFREELAARGGRRRRRRGRPGDRRDRRPGRVLLRPDGPARAARARPVRVHDPALGRDRRGDRRRAGRRRGADAAAGDPGDRRHADRPVLAIRRGPVGAPTDGRWARLARAVMRRPVAVLVPTLASCSCSARRSSTSGSTPRTPRSCRPSVPSRAAFDLLAPRVRRGRVRAARARDPDRRPGDEPRQPRRALRLLAAARRRPARPPRRPASSTSTRG